nr:Chain A, TAR DNA-binding protein 43 [Homo sapiens]
GNNQGSN